jgi:phosphoglycolate/pyridoxal phosphate phosphatase family enzyme
MSTLPFGVRLVIFDLDGVVYRGAEPVAGVADAIATLEGAGIAARFATNNSTVDRDAYVTRLAQIGIATRRDAVVTSTSATIEHLARHAPQVRRLLAIGEEGLFEELAAAGFAVTAARDAVAPDYAGEPLAAPYDAVVVGLDRGLDYRAIAAAMTAIREGAAFIATNADERYPTAGGLLPGAGTAVAALQIASGAAPIVIGKPAPAMFLSILATAGIRPGEALVVGDNPAADIVAARRAGIPSLLVLTGVADAAAAAALDGERRPDHVTASAADLPGLLGIG